MNHNALSVIAAVCLPTGLTIMLFAGAGMGWWAFVWCWMPLLLVGVVMIISATLLLAHVIFHKEDEP